MRPHNITTIHKKIFQWYAKNARSLPWRDGRNINNPYRILLSEIMLQQTQVNRVILFYKAWLKKFPTFSALAKAKQSDVLRQWSGLGYNNRAIRFHQIAKIVVEQHNNTLPKTAEELHKLPGIGKYTTHAILCFAFEQQVPVVDVNIRRVLTRLLWKTHSYSEMKLEKEIWKIAEQILPNYSASIWNQALMDIGATICTARMPKCAECFLQKNCASAFSISSEKKSLKKKEPSYKNIPRRIYRGRVLKILHTKKSTPKKIAEQLWSEATVEDIQWIEEVLQKLQNDGLIEKRKNVFSIRE